MIAETLHGRQICDIQLLLAKPQWAVKARTGAGALSTAIAAAG
jgi:hypothetical protein